MEYRPVNIITIFNIVCTTNHFFFTHPPPTFHFVAILRQSIYGTIKFGTYYTLKKIVLTNFYPNQDEAVTKDESMLVNVSCAAFAGGISSALANPTDVLKVRMQAQRRTNSSPLYKCFIDVYRTEGIRGFISNHPILEINLTLFDLPILGLYRGIFPTSQRAMTIAAVELPVYDFCKNYFMPYVGNQPVNHFVSSFIASLLAALASTPIDVIRTRLMNQKRIIRETKSSSPIVLSSSTPVYFSNSFECLKSILKNEGFLALYKGFIPSWVSDFL